MSLQARILFQYRQLFPRQTLRETAKLTGIQLTRVFRLMNGSAMKLEEYESFRKLVDNHERIHSDSTSFTRSVEQARSTLSEHELSKLTTLIERHIQWHHLIHGAPHTVSQQQLA